MERMIESLSMCLATLGRISEIWMPGALVEMGLNPLLPLTSQVSRVALAPKHPDHDAGLGLGLRVGAGHQAGQLEIVAQAEPHNS